MFINKSLERCFRWALNVGVYGDGKKWHVEVSSTLFIYFRVSMLEDDGAAIVHSYSDHIAGYLI